MHRLRGNEMRGTGNRLCPAMMLTAAVLAAALALSACSADTAATTAATAKTETVAAAETTTAQAVKATEKQTTTQSPTTTAEKITEQTTATPVQDVTEQTTAAMTHADEPVTQRETEQTTTPPFADPTTTAPGNGGHQEQPTTTAHTHTWEWIEPMTHVETIYEQVYHPPVTETWTHLVRDGNQYRCLKCSSVFLDCRECVDHCIECGGNMTTEAHYIEVTEEIVIQEEYWSDEPVGTRVVTDREGYWQCTGCGATK